MHYITGNNFSNLIDILSKDYDIFYPIKKENNRFYKKFSPAPDDEQMNFAEVYSSETNPTTETQVDLGGVRAFEPLKAFFFRAREIVAEGFKEELPGTGRKPLCIVGAKACDLKGFKVQDNVFKEHDFIDPPYLKAREDNLIISSDCTEAIDTCFCISLEGKPYPEYNYDLNLSQVSGGFIIQSGSEKGQAIIEDNPPLFSTVRDELAREMEGQRTKVTDKVKQNIKENKIPPQNKYEGMIQKNFDSDIWAEEATNCVECGACNTICPTCHCFLLYDQMDEKKMARLRVWDSCMIKDFAKVAAGVNPRPQLWMRLRNRFEKKFDFFPKFAGMYACTGCGRCISACPAKIDIRKVLKRLIEDAK
jgi:ferredoxin